MRILAALLLVIWAGLAGCSSSPFQRWRGADQALFAVNAGCHAYDAYQTDWAMEQGGRFRETNALLGSSPGDAQIYGLKLATVGIQYLVLEHVADPVYRTPWLAFSTLLCGAAVASNHNEGVRP